MRNEEEKKETGEKLYEPSRSFQNQNHYESNQNNNIIQNNDQQLARENNIIDSKYHESFSISVKNIEKNKNKEKIIIKQPNKTPKFASLTKWNNENMKNQLSGKTKYQHRLQNSVHSYCQGDQYECG